MSPQLFDLFNVLDVISQTTNRIVEYAQHTKSEDFLDNVCQVSQSVAGYLSDNILENVDFTVSSFSQITRGNISDIRTTTANWRVLNIDVLTQIISFIEPKDACSLQCCDRQSNESLQLIKEPYYRSFVIKRFGEDQSKSMISQHTRYVELHANEASIEISHVISARRYYEAYSLSKRYFYSGIIGLVCDLAWLQDEKVAKVLSKKRYMGMSAVVTQRDNDAVAFKRLMSSEDKGCGHASFLSIETASRSLSENEITEKELLSKKIVFPGFLGFAVNLLCLREEHEYLRMTIYWSLFRDLMVFETAAAKWEYKSLLNFSEATSFWGVALDDYSDSVLAAALPRFRSRSPRDLDVLCQPPAQRLANLEVIAANGYHSSAILRYSN